MSITAPRTVTLFYEDLERIASAFNAIPVLIKTCDATDASNVATIFERHIYTLLEEADAEAKRAASAD